VGNCLTGDEHAAVVNTTLQVSEVELFVVDARGFLNDAAPQEVAEFPVLCLSLDDGIVDCSCFEQVSPTSNELYGGFGQSLQASK
jgi:hypothetical protein